MPSGEKTDDRHRDPDSVRESEPDIVPRDTGMVIFVLDKEVDTDAQEDDVNSELKN